jgi:tetratricopeptide (TPR) repeat protein
MPRELSRILRVTVCTVTVVGASLQGDVALAQWYRTYDDALRAFTTSDLLVAEAKLKDAKREAEAAGRRPGRSVLRYGSLREPFIPDYWLGQVYTKLAEQSAEAASREKYWKQARDAFAFAQTSGQVRDRDPEFTLVQTALEKSRSNSGPSTLEPEPGAGPPSPDPLIAARDEIKRLIDAGERALGNRSWDAASTSFQDATKKLDATPSLRSEFGRAATGLNEASLGRQFDQAVDQLNAGRYSVAIDAFDQLGRQSDVSIVSAAIRALFSEMPRRLADSRLGQSIASADALYRERRWAAARDAYEAVHRQGQAAAITTPRVRDSFAQIPERLKDAQLNAAIAEKRFSDALAIDPRNPAALAGEYNLGLLAYNSGRWADALRFFELVSISAGPYRDVAERKLAAEMQVEFAAGVAAQGSDLQAARAHYERVQALKDSIKGPLLNSPVVVEAAENASSRLRRIRADVALTDARQDYENLSWDKARNNVNLVLTIFPGDPAAEELLGKLNNKSLEQSIKSLSETATGALSRGDLTAAREAATQLSALVPSNRTARDVLSAVDSTLASRRAEQVRRSRWFAALAITLSIPLLLLMSSRRRGHFFAMIGQPARALRLYERVLLQNPTDADVLRRASVLSATNGIDVALEFYFDQYLRAKPGDATLAANAADYFWKKGRRDRAVEIYANIIKVAPTTMLSDAYDRLSEFYDDGVPVETLKVLEQGLSAAGSLPSMVRLIAREYARRERTDISALAVYQLARDVDGSDHRVRQLCARGLLAQGRLSEAIPEAEAALTLQPQDDRSFALLLEVYTAAYASDPLQAVEHLRQMDVPPAVLISIGERLADAYPRVRPLMQTLYDEQSLPDAEPALAPLIQATRLFQSDLDMAKSRLDAAFAARGTSPLVARALIQFHHKYLELAQNIGRPPDAAVQARIAELQTEIGAWQAAIVSWQQIVSTPEWSRRSMANIDAILGPLDIVDVVHTYFTTAGWSGAQASDLRGAGHSLLVSPGSAVNLELARRFKDTPVFCHSSIVTVDNIVALKRDVLERAKGTEGGIAFLITTFAVRHDVYALIYAFMTESPAVTFIPLDAHAIRDAIVEARTRVHLERTLHQWLGHTDIYETHNPVSNAATFFGRGQFINRLVLKISRGENFGIFGLRKIGKTSLVYRLRDLSRDHLVAYVDLQGVSSRKVDEVYVRLLESLTRDTRMKYPDVSLQPPRTPSGAGSAGVATAFHQDLLAIRGALENSGRPLPHVLLLLDEIELMVPQGSSAGFEGHQDFFRHIRGLYQQERFIVSAVVGASPVVCRAAAWNGRDNPVFQFYDEVFLAALDRMECNQMVQGLGELMGVRFDAESLSMIYSQTAGHPYVTRQLCSRLVKFFPERPLDVRAAMVTMALDQYLAQSGDYFAGILEGYLDDMSRRIVETIAIEGDEGTSRTLILNRVEELNVGRHVGDQALGDLELAGLIRREGERYSLCIPLFRRWLRRSWLDLE